MIGTSRASAASNRSRITSLLAIDRDGGAAGQGGQIDAKQVAIAGELRAAMHQAFASHALGNADLLEQSDRTLFEHPRLNAPFNVVARPRFEDDAFDAVHGEQAGKQQSWPRADDADLGSFSSV